MRSSHRIDVERLAWIGALVLAAVARLPALGALPLSVSDSARAYAIWQVAGGHLPGAWSGDLVQSLTAAIVRIFGAGDGTARLASALLGIAFVGTLWFYRPFVGRAAALLAAYFLALSPVSIVVSRSLSPYGAGALFALGAGAALLNFIDRPRPAPVAWMAGLIGLGFSTDASFLVFLIAAMLFCAIEGLWLQQESLVAAGRYVREHGSLLRSAGLILLAGLIVSLTRFGIVPDRLRSGATVSWSDAFLGVPAAAAANLPPWHFPITALLAYEPFIFIGGVASAIVLILRGRSRTSLGERFVLYWGCAALVFALVAVQREAGQLPALIAALCLLTAVATVELLGLARWDLLRQAVAPSLLAIPAFVYVLFVFESTTVQTPLSGSQQLAMALLVAGGAGLIVLGAMWARESAPAYLAICALVVGTFFAIHTLTRVGFQAGDEFLLGPVATAGAPALGSGLAQIATQVRGNIGVDPSLSPPMAWYTRGNPAIRIQSPTPTSAAAVTPVNSPGMIGFTSLVPENEIVRAWYPDSINLTGILRWLLYRQAWGPVRSTAAQVLVRGEQP
jgi:Dolichyl-phosphate-mannose-protein mannosyltransferase